MNNLTVIILAFNEEKHIARAIASVCPIAKHVVVVDSFSTDNTVEIARVAGATVLQNPFVNHAKQFAWALNQACVDSEWVMRLDADEVVEPNLVQEINETLSSLPPDITGMNLKRKHIFLGRWIRFGGRYPVTLLRIWRKGAARVEDRWMDEHMVLVHGSAVTLNGGFADWNLKDLGDFTSKHNRYATHEAVDVVLARHGLSSERLLSGTGARHPASFRRLVKVEIYNRIPFYLAAPSYFVFRYILQLGFLDGLPGLIYHFLQGFWYRFLVGAKVFELERALSGKTETSEVLAELSRLTGYDISEFGPLSESARGGGAAADP